MNRGGMPINVKPSGDIPEESRRSLVLAGPGSRSSRGYVRWHSASPRSPKRSRRHLTLVFAAFLISLLPFPAAGQQAVFPFIYHPSVLAENRWQFSAGLTLAQSPEELTEEAWIPWPAIDLHALYGLPANFLLDGRVLSQVLQNHISVGGRWVYSLGDLSFCLGDDFAFWFGYLKLEGFNSRAGGWLNYPSITIGYNTGDVRLALKMEAIFNIHFMSYVGKEKVSVDQDRLAGVSLTAAIEQAFWKRTNLTLGFKATFTKFDWRTWSLFSTFDRYLFYPEIIVGFIL
jgi:hypothetical protein